MLLSAQFLDSVGSVNDWTPIEFVQFSEGDPVTVYLSLVDLSKAGAVVPVASPVYVAPAARRYMPAVGATLQVIIQNIDDAKTYTKTAVQAFATSDPSIWSFTISANDAVTGTVNLTLVLTEGSVVRRGLVKAGLRVFSTTPRDC